LPLNLDKLDDYFLYFAAIPTAWGFGVIFTGGASAAPMGFAILAACAALPALDHIRANVADDSATKRIRSWLFMITSAGIMLLLVATRTSFYSPLSWFGIGALYAVVWAVIVQFKKASGHELDPYERMYLASGQAFGFFVPIIAYIGAAVLGAASLLNAGSPAIPAFFLVMAFAEVLLTGMVVRIEKVSRNLLTFPAPPATKHAGRARHFFRALQEYFPYLSLAMVGIAAESGLRVPRVLVTFVVGVAGFVLLGVTVPAVSVLGWNTITFQIAGADLALAANVILYSRLPTAEVMKGGWLPRF